MAEQKKYLDQQGLILLLKKIKAEFVAKEAGKALSTNDFTDELKAKLEGIAAEATKVAVYNGLDSDSATDALSAAQGKALKGMIDAINTDIEALGTGDMLKSDYDKDGDGIVDKAADADKLGGVAAAEYALKTDLTTFEEGFEDLEAVKGITAEDVAKWDGAQAAAEATAAGALAEEKERAEAAEKAASEAAAGALAEAQAKVASVTAGDNSVTVGGPTTAPTVAVKLDPAADNAIKLGESGLKVEIGAAPEYSIVKAADSGDYAAVYNLTKDGTIVGASINIPKDMVVQSGTVVENPEGQAAGTYIKLVLQNVAEPLYINVGSLIEYVTSGSATGDMVVVAVSDDHKVTATITDGTITAAKLTTEVQTAIGMAHTHENAEVLNGITADKVALWDTVGDFVAIEEADIEAAWAAAV